MVLLLSTGSLSGVALTVATIASVALLFAALVVVVVAVSRGQRFGADR